MKSLLYLLFGSFFLFLFSPKGASAQSCYATSQWTFDPAPDPDGTYDAGTTVQMCVDITSFFANSNWLAGMELLLPEAWDPSSINIVAGPEGCVGNGTWLYLDAVNCGLGDFGPGFYYDSNSGGQLDGSPCNNFGDVCTDGWQFCFEVSLSAACGGPGIPLDGSDIMPKLRLVTEPELAFQFDPQLCGYELIVQPDLPELTLNCCDAQPGISPGTVYACGDEPYNLYDSLLTPKDVGGTWSYSGQGAWSDVSGSAGLGTFNPLSDPLGDYTYTVAGSGGCNNSTTIHVQAVQTVEMEYITACELININEYLLIPNPENFVYYKIGYPEIQIELEGGIFDPAVNPTGIYTGVYTNSDGCLSSFQIFITAGEDVNSGTTATVTYCDFPDLFCPMESLQNLQPDLLNNPITLGGNWIVFDENGIYLEFYSHWDVCLTANELAQYGDNLVFKYAIGIAPCSPSFTDLNFFIGASEYFYSASVCPDAGPSNLIDFFPVYVPSGGAWTDSNGAVVVEFILPSLYPPGSVQTFYYSIGTGSCVITYTLELHIGLSSGEDITVHLCGDGSTLDLNTILANNATPGGTWSTGNEVVLDPENSGEFVYSLSNSSCTDSVAVYTVNIDPQIIASNIQASCSASQTYFTVTFTLTGGVPPYTISGDSGDIAIVDTDGGTFTSNAISLLSSGSYSFTITDNGACESVNVSGSAPDCSCPVTAAFAASNQTICVGSSVDLELDLNGGTPGTYSVDYIDGSGTTSLTGLSDGAIITLSPTTTTTYTLTSVSDGNCIGSVIGSVTVTVEQLPDAGPDNTYNFCGDGSVFVFYPEGGPLGGVFTPSQITLIPANSGVYPYTVAGNLCPNDVANYTINIDPQLVISPPETICSPDLTNYSVVFTNSGGIPPYTVNGLPVLGNTFTSSPILLPSGFSFTVDDSGPCGPVTVQGSAPVCCPIEAYWGASDMTICAGEVVDLNLILEGGQGFYDVAVDENGVIINLSNISSGAFSAVSPEQTTTYTILTVSDWNCTVNLNESVTVTVEPAPNAGPDVNLTLCADGEVVDLNDYLDTSAFQNGDWNMSSVLAIEPNSGVYTYTVEGEVCPNDVANYTIVFAEGPAVTSVNADCSGIPSQFTVSFEITGGTPPYEISGAGTFSGNTFVSDPISVASGEAIFAVSDSATCTVEVSGSVSDSDGDGICDAGEIAGCQDPMASNFNPLATDPGNCFYEAGDPDTLPDEMSELVINPGGGMGGGETDTGAKGILVHVFTNPAMSDEVKMEITGVDRSVEKLDVKIMDVLGNVRFESEMQAQGAHTVGKLTVSSFANGVYLVHVVSGEEVGIVRLVVNR